jgi:hypothetical protein
MSCRLLAAEVLVTAALWAIVALVFWSNRVVSMLIPFVDGMVELRVAVTAKPLVNEVLLLVALMVKAIGVSTVAGGGVVVDPPASDDLEQEINEPIRIGRNVIIFFIFNDYLLMITPSVWL